MVITFQPESHVASCKTLSGAQRLVSFLTEKLTGNPQIVENITFRSIIETSGKVSVHASIRVNETGRDMFKEAVVDFKAQLVPGA
jgi:hypothetical protein